MGRGRGRNGKQVLDPVAHVICKHLIRAGHVQLVHERAVKAGGGQVLVARCPTLRDVLLLRPVDPECLAAADAGQGRAFAEPSLWDGSLWLVGQVNYSFPADGLFIGVQ